MDDGGPRTEEMGIYSQSRIVNSLSTYREANFYSAESMVISRFRIIHGGVEKANTALFRVLTITLVLSNYILAEVVSLAY